MTPPFYPNFTQFELAFDPPRDFPHRNLSHSSKPKSHTEISHIPQKGLPIPTFPKKGQKRAKKGNNVAFPRRAKMASPVPPHGIISNTKLKGIFLRGLKRAGRNNMHLNFLRDFPISDQITNFGPLRPTKPKNPIIR